MFLNKQPSRKGSFYTPDRERLLGIRTLSLPDAARILRIHTGALSRWVHGHKRAGMTYSPVIRPEPENNPALTWGEFLEAGWVTEYRRDGTVPLNRIRRYLASLRARTGERYPIAHRRTFDTTNPNTTGTSDSDTCLIHRHTQNGAELDPRSARFVAHAALYDSDVIRCWFPDPDKFPDVQVDPLYSSGLPTIRGIRTEILHEFVTAGEPVEWLATVYKMDPNLIQQAADYENSAI